MILRELFFLKILNCYHKIPPTFTYPDFKIFVYELNYIVKFANCLVKWDNLIKLLVKLIGLCLWVIRMV